MRTNLDRAMREGRWTGRLLAQQVGTHESNVSRWRCGRHVPDEAMREKLAATLDTSVEELFPDLATTDDKATA